MSILGKSKTKDDEKNSKSTKNNDNGIFLDTIERKNGVRSLQSFKPNDIKALKSLLDVSSFTMWRKSSNGQKEMQEDYKELYKSVGSGLSMLYKQCDSIEKKGKDLEKGVINYNKSREEISSILKKVESASKPVNTIETIKEINRLTSEFNKLRNKEPYCSWIKSADVCEVNLKNYKDFEKSKKMVLNTTSPVTMIPEFVEKKRQIEKEEAKKIFYNFVNETNRNIKANQAAVFNRLDELEDIVGVNKGALKKYFAEKGGYLKIDENMYDELANALIEKLKPQSGKSDVLEKRKEEFKKEIKAKIKESLKETHAEAAKEEKKHSSKRSTILGFFNSLFSTEGRTKLQVQVVAKVRKSFKNLKKFLKGNYLKGNGYKFSDEAIKAIEAFCDAWADFEAEHASLSSLIKSRDENLKILNSFVGKYNEYIGNISRASIKVAKPSNIQIDEKELESFEDKILAHNRCSAKINVSAGVLREECNEAESNIDAINGMIKKYVSDYSEQFKTALKGQTIDTWVLPSSCSKLTLGQSVLFTYYCLKNYKDNHFYLGIVAEHLEKIEKAKLGITSKEFEEMTAHLKSDEIDDASAVPTFLEKLRNMLEKLLKF